MCELRITGILGSSCEVRPRVFRRESTTCKKMRVCVAKTSSLGTTRISQLRLEVRQEGLTREWHPGESDEPVPQCIGAPGGGFERRILSLPVESIMVRYPYSYSTVVLIGEFIESRKCSWSFVYETSLLRSPFLSGRQASALFWHPIVTRVPFLSYCIMRYRRTL
jgi:hypothetical protein